MATFATEPELCWRFHRPRISMLETVERSGRLERRGVVRALITITQYIDRLHRHAGEPRPHRGARFHRPWRVRAPRCPGVGSIM
jgi:hypothetical protein